MPPRAVSSTATSTSERRSTARAAAGPVQSPLSVATSLTEMPSVVHRPTARPAQRRMRASRRALVVLPLGAGDERDGDAAELAPRDLGDRWSMPTARLLFTVCVVLDAGGCRTQPSRAMA